MNAPLPRRPSGILLAAIACSGTLAMHIFVPVLPAVARDFAATPGAAQLTLTVYLIGLAAGQLIYGPLSDRLGRRPVLIMALLVFLAATLLAALAPSLNWLIAAGVLQALGGCGGLVLGRAMARDGATPEQAARQLALLVMVMTAAPAIAPLVGSMAAVWVGWRGIFGVLGVAGVALLIVTVTTLPETNRARAALPNLRAMLAVYGQLLGRRAFCAYAIGGACMSTSIYAFLSASPFLFIDVLHRPPVEVGVYYMVLTVGITFGSWIASRLALRVRIPHLLRLGALLGMLGASGLLAVDVLGKLGVVAMLAPMSLFAIGVGPDQSARHVTRDRRRSQGDRHRIGTLRVSADELWRALHPAGRHLACTFRAAGCRHSACRCDDGANRLCFGRHNADGPPGQRADDSESRASDRPAA